MCCNAGGAAEAAVQSSEPKYKWKEAKCEGGVTVESLGAPGLLKVGSDVFAVAEAQWKKNSEGNSFTGIASQIITKDNANTPVEVLNEVKETQFLEDGSEVQKKKVDVSRPTTVVQGNDIYMLVGKYSRTAAGKEGGGAENGGLLLVKGNVSDGSGGDKRIKWKDKDDVSRISVGELDSWTRLTGGGGSGIKMEDDTLVFPVEGTKNEDEKAVSLIIHDVKDTAVSWKLSNGTSDGGCSDPSVVEWGKEDKKLIMMTACDDGRRRVYESGDKGKSWTEALGTLSCVWGNKKGGKVKAVRSGFITAKIDGVADKRNVMLVTLPVYPEEESKKENGKGKLHLWLTDNTHIVDIGPVSGKDDDAAASSLLYKSGKDGDNEQKGEKLIALYEKKGDEGKTSPGVVSVLLSAQLKRVKEVLTTWKKADDLVSELCPSKSAEEDASTGDACSSTVRITDGLVGFLSGNFSDNTWRDEYLGVNATVKNKSEGGKKATNTSDGVQFHGAWAEWPVGKKGDNQLYHFANYNFTLVATVSIDKVPTSGNIPLMGARWEGPGEKKVFGLSYDSEKKRIVFCGGGQNKELSSTSEKKKHVVILLRNGTQGSAYVDDIIVGNAQLDLMGIEKSKGISHFYIGGDGSSTGNQEGLSVTVRNVLLYNRPLDDDEIAGLVKNKITHPKREGPKTSATSPLSPAASGLPVQGTVPLSNSAGQQPSDQGQPKGSIAAGAGGASTPATSTAASSSGQEPVKQPTSGTSSSGNKNADGTPLSGGDKAVATGSGETVQGDGSLHTAEVSVSSGANGETVGGTDVQEVNSQVRGVNAAALSSSLGNVSQGNNTDAGTVRGSGLLPLLLLLGLWMFAAL
ncbi:putative trans-sialidase [Trypanosoma cruzi]|nr:putative trans-sialidase [Trypanosoma cruzi]